MSTKDIMTLIQNTMQTLKRLCDAIAFRCAAKNRNDVMFAKHNGNDVRTNINKDGHDKQ